MTMDPRARDYISHLGLEKYISHYSLLFMVGQQEHCHNVVTA